MLALPEVRLAALLMELRAEPAHRPMSGEPAATELEEEAVAAAVAVAMRLVEEVAVQRMSTPQVAAAAPDIAGVPTGSWSP